MTPEQSLKFHQPAFRNLFEQAEPDIGRFLRLAIDVFDPDPGYGPIRCSGSLFNKGCGQISVFRTAMDDARPYGYQCPNCGIVYDWSLTKSIDKVPTRIVLTSDGTATIGRCKAESDSGVVVIDQ